MEDISAKKFIVLDIDETLLNIEPLSYIMKFKKNCMDNNGKLITFFGKDYYASLRPNVTPFLRELSKKHLLIAFSTVEREVSKKKLQAFSLENYFVKIYGKEDMIDKRKSIQVICNDFNITKTDICVIDDNPQIYVPGEISSITKISPWFIGLEDNQLLPMADWLNNRNC